VLAVYGGSRRSGPLFCVERQFNLRVQQANEQKAAAEKAMIEVAMILGAKAVRKPPIGLGCGGPPWVAFAA
jgi:hypothetical protein